MRTLTLLCSAFLLAAPAAAETNPAPQQQQPAVVEKMCEARIEQAIYLRPESISHEPILQHLFAPALEQCVMSASMDRESSKRE